jgi:thiamine biosynthesis lipoprotein
MATSVVGIADDTALGCSMRVIVTRPSRLTAAKRAVDEVVDAIDAAASRFRDDSELSRLNARPETDVVVSPLLAEAIGVALRAARLTDGAVDPTVGIAIKRAGYDKDFAAVPANGKPISVIATPIPGWRAVEFSPSSRLVRMPRGVELDLGATAKALAADMAAETASHAIGGGALVSLGGDIAVAGDCPPGGWQIQISEDSSAPIEEGEETVGITSGGIATSSATVRSWNRGGQMLHHIIDPSSGQPTNGPWRTATVAAGTCVDANIAATAAIVLGKLAVSWLETRDLAARLVDNNGNVALLSGWPEARASYHDFLSNFSGN